jgi:orotidine-5'-phosphate decarboxylase
MKLCIALDMPNTTDAIDLLNKIKSYNHLWIKVGLRLFIREGKSIIDKIKKINPSFKVFLDLKLYDIPNTMADSAYEIAQMDIDMFNIHLSAGEIAINTVVNRLSNIENKPLILGVSVLTSFDESNFNKIYKQNINQCVKEWSKIGYSNNLDGVVCSVFESLDVKSTTNNNFLTLTPGIRLEENTSDDQSRVASIQKAKENKSDFIVVGRPIYQDKNPSQVIKNILEKL